MADERRPGSKGTPGRTPGQEPSRSLLVPASRASRPLRWALGLLLGFAGAVQAQTPVIPTQALNSQNQEAVSGANAPVSVTLSAPPNTRVKLYSVSARCSAGSAGITILDGATQRWSSDSAFISTATKSMTWVPPFTGSVGQALVVTLTACGAGNIGTIDVQGDVF